MRADTTIFTTIDIPYFGIGDVVEDLVRFSAAQLSVSMCTLYWSWFDLGRVYRIPAYSLLLYPARRNYMIVTLGVLRS